MSDIVITTVTGGSTGTLLKDCFFQQRGASAKYDFFAPDTTVLGSDLSSSGCDFPLDLYTWKIFSLAFSAGKVSGRWRNRHGIAEEEGTFQAQAGGHADGEEEAVSSASA